LFNEFMSDLFVSISAARLELADCIAAFILAVFVLITAANEVLAVSTVELVFALTAEVIPEVWVLVFAFITAANEVLAVSTVELVFALTAEVIPEVWVLVFAFITAERDVLAVSIAESVFALTAEVIPEVWVLVFAFITAANEVLAVSTVELVFALTAEVIPPVALFVFVFTSATTELEAFVTSDTVASEPESSPAPVSVRTVFVHTSATSVPKDVSVLALYDQIDAGSVANREDEAADIALLVFALTAEVIPEVWVLVFAFITAERDVLAVSMVDPTEKLLSTFTKSPPGIVPHVIVAGQSPLGPIDGIE
jgi:hypothetical protein